MIKYILIVFIFIYNTISLNSGLYNYLLINSSNITAFRTFVTPSTTSTPCYLWLYGINTTSNYRVSNLTTVYYTDSVWEDTTSILNHFGYNKITNGLFFKYTNTMNYFTQMDDIIYSKNRN